MDKLIFNLISSMNSDHKIRLYEKFKVSPEIGEVCIAYHWSRKWLRGIIHSLNEGPEGMPVSADVFKFFQFILLVLYYEFCFRYLC